MSTTGASSAELINAFNAQHPKKGSFEDVFGHLGTPEEVAAEWSELQALKEIVKTFYYSPIDSATEYNAWKELVKWMKKNS